MQKKYTRPIMIRDGKNLIERKRILRQEKRKIQEELKELNYELIQYWCSFFIYEKNNGTNKKLLT